MLPATAEPEGYLAEKAKGNLKVIPAGGTFRCEIEMGMLKAKQVAQIEEKINRILNE